MRLVFCRIFMAVVPTDYELDVLVNNAGISGSAEQDFYSTEAWHRIMAVNATGAFFGIKHAIPAMVANGGGSMTG
jgi:NAD(P)-dependent dehydrogenase (short-subunit alcohol dehydrogenase family)